MLDSNWVTLLFMGLARLVGKLYLGTARGYVRLIWCSVWRPLELAPRTAASDSRPVRPALKPPLAITAFIHVSTAYAHCTFSRIEEKFYPSPHSFGQLMAIIQNLTDQELEKIAPELLKNIPNTYVYTKAIAENIIKEEAGNLPIGVFRPAIDRSHLAVSLCRLQFLARHYSSSQDDEVSKPYSKLEGGTHLKHLGIVVTRQAHKIQSDIQQWQYCVHSTKCGGFNKVMLSSKTKQTFLGPTKVTSRSDFYVHTICCASKAVLWFINSALLVVLNCFKPWLVYLQKSSTKAGVIGTHSEPLPGWIDNVYGPTGIFVGAGIGILRTINVDPCISANLVPVDMAVGALIASAREVHNTQRLV
ncbi:unnamed protein product, partial [Timema podura]|nr:unnamed protein product [Timema podura]